MIKRILLLFTITSLLGCTSSGTNTDVLPFIQVNETIDLNLPQFINLQVPGGWSYAPGGINGIIVYNLNGNQFKAYERACPHLTPSSCSQMIVENNIKMKCPCDDSEFNILNGQSLTQGINSFAREYLVTNINGTVLRITNF